MRFLLLFFATSGVITWTSMVSGLTDGATRRKKLMPSVILLGVTGAIVAGMDAWLGW